MPTILAIETSCDETAVAILRGSDLVASKVASQAVEHQKYGGVVPEVASRNHLVHGPRLLEAALAEAKVGLGEIDAVAATSGPGLASSLMVGASMAKGIALGNSKPYLAINHLEGHLLSPFFGRDKIPPHVALIVSGGHTLLVKANGVGDYEVLGRTVDDAAGEAFDKVAKLLGLGYPGGPEIERVAQGGNAKRFDLPRGLIGARDHNFSFSGLKTAVRYLLPKIQAQTAGVTTDFKRDDHSIGEVLRPEGPQDDNREGLDADTLRDLCASFQRAVIDVLVKKTIRAARETGLDAIAISGGVSCNGALRTQMKKACEEGSFSFYAAAQELTTDNAGMIAFAAALRLERCLVSEVTEEIDPNLALG